ncbi:MAG TPA: TldD/PmbA family protein, partial [Candidatus Dormibacteraeota bacterium]|nr:TldD/PmbA family protein [Candidatus Dormibacteraeota bacterium]
MSGGHRSDWLAVAETVLGHAKRLGATAAEVLVMAEDSALTRFANSEIHQNVAESNVSVNVRFVDGTRVGVAASSRTDAEGLRALAETAGTIARHSAEREDWGGLPEAGPIPTVPEAFASSTAESDPELRADAAKAVISAADEAGVTAYGSFSVGVEATAVANSKGVRAAGVRTGSQLITVCMGPDGGNGYAESAAVDATSIDASAIGREAAAKARASASPVALEPGDYPVVLEEYAVVDLLDMLGYLGFSALAVEEGRSFYQPGRRIGSDLVTIVDDGTDPAGLPMAFDFEGVGKQRLTLVERGLCVDVAYDAETAHRAGRRSTGHGLPAPNPYGPFPINMLMSPGSSTRDELIGGLERGLLVT